MTREFTDATQEPRDYIKYVWAGIGLLILVMLVLIISVGQRTPKRSEVRTKHILIEYNRTDPADRARALKLIQELRQRILDGENFEELAKKYSDDEVTAFRGGDIGYQPRGTMEDQYEEYAWEAPLNELGDIIQTSYGYHIIVVTDRYIAPGDAYEKELERRVNELDSGSTLNAAPEGEPAP